MVKGFYFGLYFNWYPVARSIQEISEKLLFLLQKLAIFDNRFSNPKLVNTEGVGIEIEIMNKSGKLSLKDDLLLSLQKDIIKYDKTAKIDLNYQRDFGFSILFEFNGINLFGRLGSIQAEGLGFSFPQQFEESFEWYFELLKTCINCTNSFFGSMQLKATQITEQINDLKFPVGLVSYFKNELNLNIEDCFPTFEIVRNSDGFYLILDRSSITDNKETFESFKNKLIEANNIMRKCCPKNTWNM